MKLWYNQPASLFEEALPIGNGRLGAMVYGGTEVEKLSLNEDTFWSGYPSDKSDSRVKESLNKARRFIEQGSTKEAENEIWKHMLTSFTASYQPVGDLRIHMQYPEEGSITEYTRELDLEEARAVTSYKQNGCTYKREVFISHPEDMLCIRITTDAPCGINVEVNLNSIHPVYFKGSDEYILMGGKAPAYAAPNYYKDADPIRYEENGHQGLSFAAAVVPKLKGGTLCINDDKITIRNAEEAVLFLNIATNFMDFQTMPEDSKKDEIETCLKPLSGYLSKSFDTISYEDILNRHRSDYRNLYGRVAFELEGGTGGELPTDQRLKQYLTDKSDHSLAVLLFQYGRYLLISSSRVGSQAANLQGIWNESLRAPWSSNYTLNINLQMNYWLAENCNLSECHLPLMEFVKETSVNGRRTAKVNYGLEGWCAHHNSDLWRQTEAVGVFEPSVDCANYGFWTQGGSWVVRHVWEHFQYTGDIDFLKQYKEVVKGSGEFLLGFVTLRDGMVVYSPSTSPENKYTKEGEDFWVCENTAMDLTVLKETLGICVKMCQVLDIDMGFVERCQGIIAKIPDFKVGSLGQLVEWDQDYGEPEQHHRHLSHLYGFYPGEVINMEDTPELIPAVKKAMELRGDIATGWGIAWKINVWARLLDGAHSKTVLDNMLTYVDKREINMAGGGGVYSNLLSAHPPFQIDGNFGATAGIAEMLMQSGDGWIRLLPALPPQWQKGKISGLCAKGGFEVSLEWEEGKLLKACIKSRDASLVKIIYGGDVRCISLEEGAVFAIRNHLE